MRPSGESLHLVASAIASCITWDVCRSLMPLPVAQGQRRSSPSQRRAFPGWHPNPSGHPREAHPPDGHPLDTVPRARRVTLHQQSTAVTLWFAGTHKASVYLAVCGRGGPQHRHRCTHFRTRSLIYSSNIEVDNKTDGASATSAIFGPQGRIVKASDLSFNSA